MLYGAAVYNWNVVPIFIVSNIEITPRKANPIPRIVYIVAIK